MEPSLRDWENGGCPHIGHPSHIDAAMEPSLRDWENAAPMTVLLLIAMMLQWSPVLGTGKTSA